MVMDVIALAIAHIYRCVFFESGLKCSGYSPILVENNIYDGEIYWLIVNGL